MSGRVGSWGGGGESNIGSEVEDGILIGHELQM